MNYLKVGIKQHVPMSSTSYPAHGNITFDVPDVPDSAPEDSEDWRRGHYNYEVGAGAAWMASPKTMVFSQRTPINSMCGAQHIQPRFARLDSWNKWLTHTDEEGNRLFTSWRSQGTNVQAWAPQETNDKFKPPKSAPSWFNQDFFRALRLVTNCTTFQGGTQTRSPLRSKLSEGVVIVDAGTSKREEKWCTVLANAHQQQDVLIRMPGGLEFWNVVHPDLCEDEYDTYGSTHTFERFVADMYDELETMTERARSEIRKGELDPDLYGGSEYECEDVQAIVSDNSVIWNISGPVYGDYYNEAAIGLACPKRFADMIYDRIRRADNNAGKLHDKTHYIMFSCNFVEMIENVTACASAQVWDVMRRTEVYRQAFDAVSVKTCMGNNPNEGYHDIGFVCIQLKENTNVKS